MRELAVIAMLGGCGFSIAVDPPGGTTIDGGIAVEFDGAVPDDGCTTFSTFLDTCQHPSGNDLQLTGTHTFNTDTGVLVDATQTVIPLSTATVQLASDGIDVQAVFVADLRLDGTLRATGSRPFAIVASGQVELAGSSLIEVGMGGAGARSDCGPGNGSAGENDSKGGGGGGGGALGANGGHGSNGDSDAGQSDGGPGGAQSTAPAAIIGGCPGGKGGDGDEVGGAGGVGGGAVFVVARERIFVGAASGINAGGGGGIGGLKTDGNDGDGGGGGGGSGGMILLEAADVRNDGILSANGGGGAEGSDDRGSSGKNGSDATLGTEAASGGDGNSTGGQGGGAGGNSASPNGTSVTVARPGGGGGGGGSVGFIRILGAQTTLGSRVSPLPTP